ncbi:putative matrix metalloproteinase-19-like [Apostichopus japonicus]|uniref:Putative matrix metalloproteinase-19-like n=1 Tax=Stichopus japonicus TaxID=307972 RepID=A0A2G8KRI1_STIJA|nr:putative matrix metalloproteinase-19-like [Apostichopus japonicus]
MDLKYYFENFSVHLTRAEVRDAIERALNSGLDTPLLHFVKQMIPVKPTSRLVSILVITGTGRTTHSMDLGALMYPWYQGYVENYELPEDDIQGIQQMYGIPPEEETPAVASGPGRTGENLPDTCTSPWDAVDQSFDAKVYAFKGKHLWRIRNNGVASGFPKKITSVYKGAPSNVNAVVTSKINQKTYIFKGNRYWRYTNYKLDANFPKKLKKTGLPKSVTAAFVWGGNGKIHIFKGNHFYIFNERTDKIKGGKRTISDKWRGIPSSVTSAFQWKNGKTYFFRGDNYWRFDDNTLSKERGYPKSKALYWMGCGAGPDVAEPIRVMPEENEEGGN